MGSRPGPLVVGNNRLAPLVVIVGETASGKSALAMALAEKFNGEIISADAATVRKSVDIGTAKPSAEDRAKIPHHLIDVAEPCQDFTAAVFKELAMKAIDDISDRGKLPILVGGTGLYIDGVIFNYSFLPAGNREARETLNNMSVAGLLKQIDAKGLNTEGIDIRNKRRLIRLLETDGARPASAPLRPNTLILGTSVQREDLNLRIELRTDEMIKAGLEQEVKSLANTYGWNCEALKAIGYHEWFEYFEDKQNLAETRNRIIKSTKGLAKRQRTWFKRNNSIHWVNNTGEAVGLITSFLNK